MVVSAALQEDVDVVGLSILSGRAHDAAAQDLRPACSEQGMDDVLVTAGGIIPDDDIPALEQAGVSRVFGPGTTIREVGEYIRANVRRRVAIDRQRAERDARRGGAQRGPARAGPAADRGREPHGGRRGGAARALSDGRRRRTWSASPARPGRARARSSPRSSARRASRRPPGGGHRDRPVEPDHRRRDPRRSGADAGHASDRDVFIRSMASRGHSAASPRARSRQRPSWTRAAFR